VSLTLIIKPCHGFSVIESVVHTDDKFIAGVVNTSEQLSWVTTTLAINLSSVTVPLTFSFAQLAKGKSLGHSKPATISQIKALQHTVWIILLYPSLTKLTAFYRNKMSTTRCE
jgi:hypothetical protein